VKQTYVLKIQLYNACISTKFILWHISAYVLYIWVYSRNSHCILIHWHSSILGKIKYAKDAQITLINFWMTRWKICSNQSTSRNFILKERYLLQCSHRYFLSAFTMFPIASYSHLIMHVSRHAIAISYIQL